MHPATTPSIAELVSAWEYSQAPGDIGRNFVLELSNWQKSIGKPIMFCEIGYGSRDAAALDPWAWDPGDTYNAAAQSNCIEAFFRVWENKSWFKGAFIWTWHWDPNAGGAGNPEHTVQNKPDEESVRIWYTGSYTPTYVTISNSYVTPFYVTNNNTSIIQFFADVRTDDPGGITEAKINLGDIGGPPQDLMTNAGGDTWRYTFQIPAGLAPDEYKVSVVGYDNEVC